MIHLARLFTRADLAAAPGRGASVAVLLVAAAWLPAASGAQPGYGVALAAVVAFCATLGTVALSEDRTRLLDQNGARPATLGLVAVASVLPPAAAAAVVALGVGLVAAAGPSVAVVLGVTVAAPVVAAPVALWVARRAADDAQGGRRRRGWLLRLTRSLGLAVVALACVVMPPLGLALVALRLSAGAWSTTQLRRAAGALLALAVAGVVTLALGSSTTWWDLAVVLLFGGPGLAVAVAVLGMHVGAAGAALASRAGPRARLALAPLVGRRRALAPLVAVISFVAALSVSEAVVGASFGQREADRERDLPTVTEPAGNRPDQAIAVVPPVDPAALRAIAAEESTESTRAVVIELVGVDLFDQAFPLPLFGRSATLLGSPVSVHRDLDSAVDQPQGVRTTEWIGVVAPDDLEVLGWSAAAPALADGELVLLGRDAPRGLVEVQVLDGSIEHPATGIDGPSGGVLLPGALLSAEAADRLTALRSTARVVVVPAPDVSTPPTQADLVAVATAVGRRARALPSVEPTAITPTEQAFVDLYEVIGGSAGSTTLAGADEIVLFESGPLNDLPMFARTAEEGRGRLVGLVALTVLMTVAGVLLALGATRADDVVLEVQGAPVGFRSAISALQAGAVAGSAAAFAALSGIGVPALAFAIYNGREGGLPDIPLVVPAAVWVSLAAVVVLSVVLSAAVSAGRRPATPDQLAALGA